MKKYAFLVLALAFLLTFTVSYYFAVDSAYAGCPPCSTPTCGSIECLDWGVCQCTFFPCRCCKCVPNDT